MLQWAPRQYTVAVATATVQEAHVNAEVISIGTELLLGEIVDHNSAHIARQLRTIGLDLHYMTTVGDNLERIVHVLRAALDRADVVITTGGLGPTVDDVTREGVARATNRPLILDPELLRQIEAFFARLGRPMKENTRRQAYIPQGATPIPNPVGTAPAFIVEDSRGVIIALPGVPREMEYLLEHAVLPYLRQHLGHTAVIKSKVLRTVGVGESEVDTLIADLMTSANPTVGLAAHPGQTDVRITAKAPTEAEADRLIATMEARVRERLGDVIYGEGEETVEEVVARLLRERGWTLAIAQQGPDSDVVSRLVAVGISPLQAAVCPEGDRPEESGMIAWARGLRAATGADAALAVWAYADADSQATCLALATGDGERFVRLAYAPLSPHRQRWVANRALDMIRRAVMKAATGGESSA